MHESAPECAERLWSATCLIPEYQTMQPDIERRQAIAELLSLPDGPGLHRSHRLTVEGKPDRHQMLPYLAAAFVQARLLELGEREALRRNNSRH
jgi:hypothetical protein